MQPTLGEHACLASATPVSLGRAMRGLHDFKTQEVLTPSGTMRDRQHRSIAPDCTVLESSREFGKDLLAGYAKSPF